MEQNKNWINLYTLARDDTIQNFSIYFIMQWNLD